MLAAELVVPEQEVRIMIGEAWRDDVEVLENVLKKDSALLAGVRAEQLSAPTPCAEYDVRALVNHIVGGLQMFAATVNGRSFDGDPASFESTDPVADCQAAADELVSRWQVGGIDRTISLMGLELPAQLVLTMTLVEYVTHGCDLALATDQAVPFSEAELALTLERAQASVPEEYRGEGKPFGPAIDVAPDAPVLDRLFGFMGRAI